MVSETRDCADNPRVSVIINVRNGAAFLREAVDSVLRQTFSNWELIIFDNCSTDQTAEIVAEYSDTRFRYYLASEEMPLGPARSAAMSQACGEWTAFLDYDDVWMPDKLALQIELANADSAGRVGMIYGRTLVFFPNGREQDFDTVHEFRRLPEGDLFEEFFRSSCFVTLSSSMFRRSALDQIGPIPRDFDLIGDFFLFIAIARSYEVRAVQQVVCRYRRHGANMSMANWIPMHGEAIRLVNRWSGDVNPRLASQARQWHATMMALMEIRRWRSFTRGISRLATQGSVLYLLSRPFVHLARLARRRLGRPRTQFPDEGFPSTAVARGKAIPSDFPLMLSIVIVNWKVRDLLRDCLNSVYAQIGLVAEQWEVIVVDNDSGDGSVEMVRREFPGVVLIANSNNVGFAKANNQAFRLCRGRFVYLLNPDVVLLDPAIDRLLEIIQSNPEIGALGSRLLNTDHSVQRWTAGSPPGLLNVFCHFLFVYHLLPPTVLPGPLIMEREPAADAEVGWLSGASLMLRREALGEKIFDERYFMYGEDIHLCQSLKEAGWKVVYTPRVEIVHYGGQSTDSNTAEVQLNRMSNLRRVFAIRRNAAALLWFDAVLSAGFLLRALGFSLAAIVRPRSGYRLRAESSRRFFSDSIRSLFSR